MHAASRAPLNNIPLAVTTVSAAVIIRAATVADAQRIHELHTSAVRAMCAPYYAPEIVDAWLADRSAEAYLHGIRSGAMFVAQMNSQTAGFGEAVPGAVIAVFVNPAFAGRGIGSALLAHALSIARASRGVVRLESTLNAVGFYQRFGFSEVKHSVVRRNRVEVPIVLMEHSAG